MIFGKIVLVFDFYIDFVFFYIPVTECARHRRQYIGYGYGQQYGLYSQGWMNNRYLNPQGHSWNNNFNWNQGNRYPEWYYNTSNTVQLSILCFIVSVCYILIV